MNIFSAPTRRPHIVKVVWPAFVGGSGIVPGHKSLQKLDHFFSEFLNQVRSAESQVVPLLGVESHVEQMLLQLRPRRVEHLDGETNEYDA